MNDVCHIKELNHYLLVNPNATHNSKIIIIYLLTLRCFKIVHLFLSIVLYLQEICIFGTITQPTTATHTTKNNVVVVRSSLIKIDKKQIKHSV